MGWILKAYSGTERSAENLHRFGKLVGTMNDAVIRLQYLVKSTVHAYLETADMWIKFHSKWTLLCPQNSISTEFYKFVSRLVKHLSYDTELVNECKAF